MANVDAREGSAVVPFATSGKSFQLRGTIDTDTTNVASGDIVMLLNVPANTFINKVLAYATTAEGGTLTIDVGDFGTTSAFTAVTADGWFDGINANATTVYNSATLTLTEGTPNTTAASSDYYAGKLYTAASVIGVTFNNAADAAIIEVVAFCESIA